MTKATLTHNHVFLDDCKSTTSWSKLESGLTATLSVVKHGYFEIAGTCDNVADEKVYYEKDITNFSTNTYKKYMIRWYTEVASNGVGLKVQVQYDDLTTKYILPTSGADTPQFSADNRWQLTTGSFETGKTVHKVRIWADDDPDTIDSGTYKVYVDFILFYVDDFTFPYHSGPETLQIETKDIVIPIPGRVGGIRQSLGMKSPILVLQGNMDSNTGWGTAPLGARFYEIMFEGYREPWQWFTSDLITCKMAINRFTIKKDPASRKKRLWELELQKFDTYCGSEDWVWDYF